MAWSLRFDSGLQQYCAIQTPVNETSTQWRVEWRAKLVDGSLTTNRIIAKLSGSTDYISTWHTSTQERLALEINNTAYTITGGTIVTDDGEFHDYKLEANGTQLEYFIDDVSKGTVAGSPVFEDMQAIGRGGSAYFDGEVEYFKYYDTSAGDVLKFNWDAESSDHSNTGQQPVLTETVAGNDATGVNFPTDGSAWVNTGGDDEIEITGASTSYTYSQVNSTIDMETSIGGETTSSLYIPVGASIELSSEIDIDGDITGILYTPANATIDLMTSIEIEGNVTGSTYPQVNASIELSAEFDIVAQATSFSYPQTNATVNLETTIEIDAGDTTVNYPQINASVILSSDFDIIGESTSYQYTQVNANISLNSDSEINLSGLTMSYGDDGVSLTYGDDGITINYE